jgi:hypothetical protein
MPISDRNSASTDSTLTPFSAMTNPQYLLKYQTDKEFADFLVRCIPERPVEFLVVFRKHLFIISVKNSRIKKNIWSNHLFNVPAFLY